MILPYNVTFVGDFFSTTVSVELDTEEPNIAELSEDELDDVARHLATNILEYHYGWKVAEVSDEIAVVAG